MSAERVSLKPDQISEGMEVNPAKVEIYRGGNSLEVRPNIDIQIDKITGFVKTTHGLSLDIDANTLKKFGTVYRIESIPAELKIVQRGRRLEHFEIVSRRPVLPDQYQALVDQITMTQVD